MVAAVTWAEPDRAESAAVQIGAHHVRVEWAGRREVLPVGNRIAGLNEGLCWVAARAAEAGHSLEAWIIWPEDARMAVVEPDGRYHWLDVSRVGL